MPSLKLLGSNAGIDTNASMSPLATSIATSAPDWSPIRRAAYCCSPSSIVSWTRLAAAVGLGIELLDQLAARGDLDPLAARRAAQVELERFFEPLLADLEAGNDQQRVLVLGLIFLGVGGADIADQMADRRPVRIDNANSRAWPARRAGRAGAR